MSRSPGVSLPSATADHSPPRWRRARRSRARGARRWHRRCNRLRVRNAKRDRGASGPARCRRATRHSWRRQRSSTRAPPSRPSSGPTASSPRRSSPRTTGQVPPPGGSRRSTGNTSRASPTPPTPCRASRCRSMSRPSRAKLQDHRLPDGLVPGQRRARGLAVAADHGHDPADLPGDAAGEHGQLRQLVALRDGQDYLGLRPGGLPAQARRQRRPAELRAAHRLAARRATPHTS